MALTMERRKLYLVICLLVGVVESNERSQRVHSRSIRSPLQKYDGMLTEENLTLLWWLMFGVLVIFAATLVVIFCCVKWSIIERYTDKILRRHESKQTSYAGPLTAV